MEQIFSLLPLLVLILMCKSAPLDPENWNYFTDDLTQIINFYNKESLSPFLFKLLKFGQRKGPHKQEESVKPQTVTFFIKETVCMKSEYGLLGHCAFKPDGEVKKCTASIAKEKHLVTCESESNKNSQEELKYLVRATSVFPLNMYKGLKHIDCLRCIFTHLPN